MSSQLQFVEGTLQEVALVFMALVYLTRLYWLFSFKGGRDRQPMNINSRTNPKNGSLYSVLNIVMPWTMESTRNNTGFYIQFILFHMALISSITMSFIIPYLPAIMEFSIVVLYFQVIFSLGLVIGLYRIYRRVSDIYIRSISTPDDFFSLALLTFWLIFAILAAPNKTDNGEWHLITYFILTACFIIYVPFSKISHYLYYPFTRLWLGRTLGYRGSYPIVYVDKNKKS